MDEPKLREGRSVYTFRGMTALGRMSVGLVDSEATFGKTTGGGSAHEFMENRVTNPPNPPEAQARARAPSPLPSEEEESVVNDSEDFQWDI